MVRCENIRAVAVQAVALWLLTSEPSAGGDLIPTPRARPAEINLFLQFDTPSSSRPLAVDRYLRQPPHWLHLEAQGARLQAEDWLRDAGFSLLEERDSEGRRSYQVISSTPTDESPGVRFHARIGLPQLSAGLEPRRNMPAIGAMIPWKRYAFELEGLNEHRLGWELMGRARWSAPDEHLQYGIAIPLAVRGGPSVGVLFQVRMRWGR
jgi:hypothetical protein